MDGINLPQAAAEIPWGHNVIIIEKVKSPIHPKRFARHWNKSWCPARRLKHISNLFPQLPVWYIKEH